MSNDYSLDGKCMHKLICECIDQECGDILKKTLLAPENRQHVMDYKNYEKLLDWTLAWDQVEILDLLIKTKKRDFIAKAQQCLVFACDESSFDCSKLLINFLEREDKTFNIHFNDDICFTNILISIINKGTFDGTTEHELFFIWFLTLQEKYGLYDFEQPHHISMIFQNQFLVAQSLPYLKNSMPYYIILAMDTLQTGLQCNHTLTSLIMSIWCANYEYSDLISDYINTIQVNYSVVITYAAFSVPVTRYILAKPHIMSKIDIKDTLSNVYRWSPNTFRRFLIQYIRREARSYLSDITQRYEYGYYYEKYIRALSCECIFIKKIFTRRMKTSNMFDANVIGIIKSYLIPELDVVC